MISLLKEYRHFSNTSEKEWVKLNPQKDKIKKSSNRINYIHENGIETMRKIILYIYEI